MGIDRTLLACVVDSVSTYNKILFPPNEDSSRKSSFTFRELIEGIYQQLRTTLPERDGKIICQWDISFENYTYWCDILKIENVIFKGNISFWEDLKKIQISVKHAVFSKNFNCTKATFENTVDFSHALFENTVDFSHVTFNNPIDFSNAQFKGTADFTETKFKGTADFTETKFKGTADFTETKFTEASFVNIVFHDSAVFNKSKLKKCNFSQTEFHKKADFRYATLTNCTFKYTEFREQGAFYGVTFTDNPIFYNLILKDSTHLYFEGLNGYRDEDKEAKCSHIKNFTLVHTVVLGQIDFSEDTIKVLNLKGSIIIGVLKRRDFNPEPANWETAVILKHEEIKHNNVIWALKYKAIEKELYYKELWGKSKKSFQEWGELLSLAMSKFSNNHGQNWLKALAFTLIAPSIFFGIFYAPVDSAYWAPFAAQYFAGSRWVGELIRYYIPTNYELLIAYTSSPHINKGLKIAGGLIYFLGKILTVYGGVELVQAFRKYNKTPS